MLVDRQLLPHHRRLRAVPQPPRSLDLAAIARQQPDDDLHQRALTRPVLPDQPNQLPGAHVQVGAGEHLHAPPPRPQPMPKALAHPRRAHHVPTGRRPRRCGLKRLLCCLDRHGRQLRPSAQPLASAGDTSDVAGLPQTPHRRAESTARIDRRRAVVTRRPWTPPALAASPAARSPRAGPAGSAGSPARRRSRARAACRARLRSRRLPRRR
jgi:hypothetical protein